VLENLQIGTPAGPHGSAPAPVTRVPYMSAEAPRKSRQTTIAPPTPSATIRGWSWAFAAVHSATPSAVHCGVPSPATRRA